MGGVDPFSFVFGPDARFPFVVPPSTTVEPLGEAGAPSPALQQPASAAAESSLRAQSWAMAPPREWPVSYGFFFFFLGEFFGEFFCVCSKIFFDD